MSRLADLIHGKWTVRGDCTREQRQRHLAQHAKYEWETSFTDVCGAAHFLVSKERWHTFAAAQAGADRRNRHLGQPDAPYWRPVLVRDARNPVWLPNSYDTTVVPR